MTATAAPSSLTTSERVDGLNDFLLQLYGDDAPGYLTICSAPAGQAGGNLRTLWFEAIAELRAAAEAAIDLADQRRNVWFGVGLRREPKDGRGEARDIIAIPCIWSDIDIAHAVHKKTCLPKSEAEALALDCNIRLASSLIIQTGHGIQTHRRLKEPWILNSDDDRAQAQAILNRFKATMNRLAGAKKYKLDAVHDLPRLLRPPFTINWKDPDAPVPVTILKKQEYLRYDPADFDEVLDPAPVEQPTPKPATAQPSQAKSERSKEPSFQEILERARKAKNGDKFRALENGSDAGHGGDTSAADQAFANHLAYWFGRNYADMDAAFRQSKRMRDKWDQKHYANGETYGEATLKKAIANCRETYEPKAKRDQKQDDQYLDKSDPLSTARRFASDVHTHAGLPTLVHSGEVFYQWKPDGAYVELQEAALRAALYPWLEHHQIIVNVGETESIRSFKPNRDDVNKILDALRAIAYTPLQPPAWLAKDCGLPDPSRLLVARNGIIDLSTPSIIRPATPSLFTLNALDYDYLPDAPEPTEWLRFLDTLWPDDRESIQLLCEWFGYVLTGDRRQQKMLLLVGPPRSGKGTIARILRQMLGVANVIAPTLASLGLDFGLWGFIGKLLAIISDARLSGRTDQAIVTERLLSISGEDAIEIHRKCLPSITLSLPTRIMVLTNELPRLADSSGALANRFLVLTLEKSFLGNEDIGLTDRLLKELPGILRWAIRGWQQLQDRGHFQQPSAAQDAISEMADLASPVSAFVRDWCTLKPGHQIGMKELYEGWCAWCDEQGRPAGTQQVFGRDLRAAFPAIGRTQPRQDGERTRLYEGIAMTALASEATAKWRSQRQKGVAA